jgi:hypothetical protein
LRQHVVVAPLGDPAFLLAQATEVAAARGYHDVLPQLEFRGRCASCHAAALATARTL